MFIQYTTRVNMRANTVQTTIDRSLHWFPSLLGLINVRPPNGKKNMLDELCEFSFENIHLFRRGPVD